MTAELEDLQKELEQTRKDLEEEKEKRKSAENALLQSGGGADGVHASHPLGSNLTKRFWWVILIVITIVLMILYLEFASGARVLEKFRDVSFARGVITFIFSLGVIGIAIILTVFAFVTDDRSKDAFFRAKEIFTILVGILGTIVGFYFGTTTDNDRGMDDGIVVVGDLESSNMSPEEGSSITLSTVISGGTPPYYITINYEPQIIQSVTDSLDKEGVFEHQLTIPDVEQNMEIRVIAAVKDSKGVKIEKDPVILSIINKN